MARVDVCVNDDLKAKWAEYSASIGLSSGAAIRAMMEHQIGRDEDSNSQPKIPDKATLKIAKGVDNRPKKRLGIWLSDSEMRGLRMLSAMAGDTMSYLLSCSVRSMLTNSPQLLNHEMDEFRESNYLLDCIARELSMMSRNGKVSVKDDSIEKLSDLIKKHTKRHDSIIKSCAERWAMR